MAFISPARVWGVPDSPKVRMNSSADWVMGDYVAEAVAQIREQVGDEEVIRGP